MTCSPTEFAEVSTPSRLAAEPIASRRAFLCSMAGALTLSPLGAQAQWTAYGSNTFQDMIYRMNGRHMGHLEGAPSSSPNLAFVEWCTENYDTDREELPILLCTGHVNPDTWACTPRHTEWRRHTQHPVIGMNREAGRGIGSSIRRRMTSSASSATPTNRHTSTRRPERNPPRRRPITR